MGVISPNDQEDATIRHGASRTDGAAIQAAPSASADDRVRRLVCSIPTMAVLSLIGFVAVLWVFTRTAWGQVWDERARMSTGASARAWLRLVDPLTYITIGSTAAVLTVFVAIALLRRRFALAAAAVFIVTAANVTTQLFKAYWPTSPAWASNSLPSGHSTVAMSVATAAIVVAPTGARRWLLPFAGFGVTFVGAGTLVGHWHRPGDVIAAILLTTFYTAVAFAVVRRVQHGRHPGSAAYALRPVLSLSGSIVVGLVTVALGVRPLDHDVTLLLAAASLAGVAVIAALALAWISAVADDNVG